MNKNRKGFGALEALIVIVVVGLIGSASWYVWHSQHNAKKTVSSTSIPKSSTSTANNSSDPSYDPVKVASINNFDLASSSLKEALINDFYPDAKKNCDTENANVSADARVAWVMSVQKMVRDDFAGVQFCGSGGTSILAHLDTGWKSVGSLAMAPGCSLVDQYKISKQITPTCYKDDGSTMDVTYP